MPKITALAPTAELAEARVERYAQKIARALGGQLERFYACEPCVHEVTDHHGDQWYEATFGADVTGVCSVSFAYINGLDYARANINVDDVSVTAHEGKLNLTFALSCKVLRW